VAQRYCTNCGAVLGEEARFCPNCGRPAHQTASVPTPEADVPVPPPPQVGGADTTAPDQQAGWGRRHPLLTGCLGIIALLFLFGIIGAALGGGGDEAAGGSGGSAKKDKPPAAAPADSKKSEPQKKPEKQEEPRAQKAEEKPQAKPQPRYSVGQTAQVANVTWEVSDAFLTNRLKSSFGTQKGGRFVVIDFTFTNNRSEEVTLDTELHMILKDSQGREFGTDPDAWEFVPTDLDIFLEPVNPGVSTDGRVIYQVAADATGFSLTLDDVEFMEDKSAVFDLGVLPARTYDDPSAAATATAGP
jgi:hypothetical protein